jgi:hypothetical protein
MPEKIGEYPLGAGQSITVLLQTQPHEETTVKRLICAFCLLTAAAQADTYIEPVDQWNGVRSFTQPGYRVSEDKITEVEPITRVPVIDGRNYIRQGDQWKPTTGPAHLPDPLRSGFKAESSASSSGGVPDIDQQFKAEYGIR